MLYWFANSIPFLFYFLFFSVPLVLYPYTSELFEFNKMLVVYITTTLIVAAWIIKSVNQKKIHIRRTILDIPLLIFLASQILSTITSIDFRTSLLGYYSRYHGGLMSSVSYALLYWAYVSNMDKEKTAKAIHTLFLSAVLVSIYAILEHFGVDKDLWVQDVQNRVFSTLGQPNWLAAWIISLIPPTWAFAVVDNKFSIKGRKIPQLVYVTLSGIFLLTLLYTKSRSGFLGFAVSNMLFWPIFLFLKRKNIGEIVKPIAYLWSIIIVLVGIVGTPWTPGIFTYLKKQSAPPPPPPKVQPRELDVEISPSGDIRKVVWQGAIDVWKAYPILGSGVETFAYSYYNFRPASHNLLSEWDFLYNKAHNEYLNFLSTTGTVGMLAYLTLIVFIIIQISKVVAHKVVPATPKNKKGFVKNLDKIDTFSQSGKITSLALVCGFASILVTNFFGFSVVPVGLSFFLFPALAVGLELESGRAGEQESSRVEGSGKIMTYVVVCCMFYVLFLIGRYWVADLNYAKGLAYNDAKSYVDARNYLVAAVKLSPKEAAFWSELSDADTMIGIELVKEGEDDLAKQFILSSVSEAQQAENLSPRNVNIKRKTSSNYLQLAAVNPEFLGKAITTLQDAIKLAPTDAKLYYNYGLAVAKQGDTDKALEIFDKTIEMKSNYKNAHLAKALVLIDRGNAGDKEEAKKELQYILDRIDPNDNLTTQQLKEISD